jgi:hypothetical protein
MDQSIELPPDIYDALRREAQASGISPSEWIASRLKISSRPPETPTRELFAGLLGVIDSREQTGHSPRQTMFGDLIGRKFKRQGLLRPE